MKKYIYQLSFIMAVVLMLSACVDYGDATQAVSVNVQVVAPEEFGSSGNGLEGHTVTISRADGTKLTALTDANGLARFSDIVPDVYTVSTSWDLTSEEYQTITGDNVVNDGAVVSGNINSQLIASDQTDKPLRLMTQLSINRSLVIGKIYYAGTKDNNNKNYLAGQFIELYNQSDQPIDVSGLCIGLVESNSTPAYDLEQLHSEFADSVVLMKQVFRVPDGDSKTIQPGGTLLLTNSAIDHRVNAGTDPDLTTADFEAKDLTGKTNNNADVPALDLVFTSFDQISKMNLAQGGPTSIVIFRTNEDPAAWPLTYNYGKTQGIQSLVVPKRYVLDAVEVLKYKATGIDLATKRLYPDLDAGYTTITSASGYTGEVVYRKTSSRRGKDGHKILQDTNNSSNDFEISTTISIRNYDE